MTVKCLRSVRDNFVHFRFLTLELAKIYSTLPLEFIIQSLIKIPPPPIRPAPGFVSYIYIKIRRCNKIYLFTRQTFVKHTLTSLRNKMTRLTTLWRTLLTSFDIYPLTVTLPKIKIERATSRFKAPYPLDPNAYLMI